MADKSTMPVELLRWIDRATEKAVHDGDFLILEVGSYWIIRTDDVIRWFKGEEESVIKLTDTDDNPPLPKLP